MEQILAALPADGSEVSFDTFVQSVRAAGGRAELWLRAKHSGLITTRINEQGQHVVRRTTEGA